MARSTLSLYRSRWVSHGHVYGGGAMNLPWRRDMLRCDVRITHHMIAQMIKWREQSAQFAFHVVMTLAEL